MILPPSTELRARRSGCHAIIPSALPFSSNDNISANLIRPGSLAVLASPSEATISNFSFFFFFYFFFFFFIFLFYFLLSTNPHSPPHETRRSAGGPEGRGDQGEP